MTPKATSGKGERWRALRHFEHWLEKPMIVLGLVWLVLLVVELTHDVGPVVQALGTLIWIVFLIEFAVRLILAPDRPRFFARNVLTALALVVPALRVFRILRILRVARLARVTRGVRLVRVITGVNRGMATVGRVMQRRGFGYVMAVTALVAFGGAAGMHALERETGLGDFGTALWWTAMMLTTMGSDYWPRTAEGRALCLILALYAFTVFGYVTATLASLFLHQDRARDAARTDTIGLDDVRAEIRALREEVGRLRSDPTR